MVYFVITAAKLHGCLPKAVEISEQILEFLNIFMPILNWHYQLLLAEIWCTSNHWHLISKSVTPSLFGLTIDQDGVASSPVSQICVASYFSLLLPLPSFGYELLLWGALAYVAAGRVPRPEYAYINSVFLRAKQIVSMAVPLWAEPKQPEQHC